MTTQSLAVKLISFVITFYLEVWLLRNTLLARKLFYSSGDEEEGVPSTMKQVVIFPALPLGTYWLGGLGSPSHPSGCPSSWELWAGEFTLETLRRKPGGWLWMALALNSRGSRKALNSPPVPRIKWRWVRWALALLLQLWGWEHCLLRREIVRRTRLMLVSLSSLVSMQLNHCKTDSAMTRINVFLTFPSPKSLFTTISLTVTWGQKTKAEPKKPPFRLAVFGLVMRSSP